MAASFKFNPGMPPLKSGTFDSKVWLKKFTESGHNLKRNLRQEIMQGTLQACKSFEYRLPEGRIVSFGDFKSVSRAACKTCLYYNIEVPQKPEGEKNFTTTVEVVNRDCLEEALVLKERGLNPAVLNMASPKRPGGGYLTGAGAQEENLFRRTNYVQHLADPDKKFDPLRKWRYRLPEFSCVYSTNVMLFRAAESKGYAFLEKPIPLSFLAVAAYPNPPHTKDGKQLTPEYTVKCRQKIRLMLAVGLQQGHDSLVLSAWGCGAFGNPPRHIAQLFQEIVNEEMFLNRYKHISFAIIDDHNAFKKGNQEGNFRPFCDVFNKADSASL